MSFVSWAWCLIHTIIFVDASTSTAREAEGLRTRFTFQRPTRDNILSILLGSGEDILQNKELPIRYNYGKDHARVIMYRCQSSLLLNAHHPTLF